MSRRRELAGQLELLTPDQLNIFLLCFGTIKASAVSKSDLKNAVRLCAATIKDNREHLLEVLAQKHEG